MVTTFTAFVQENLPESFDLDVKAPEVILSVVSTTYGLLYGYHQVETYFKVDQDQAKKRGDGASKVVSGFINVLFLPCLCVLVLRFHLSQS